MLDRSSERRLLLFSRLFQFANKGIALRLADLKVGKRRKIVIKPAQAAIILNANFCLELDQRVQRLALLLV